MNKFKEIERMKSEDFERGLHLIKEAKEKYQELQQVIQDKYNGSIFQRIIGWDGKGYNVLVPEYEEYKKKYGYYYNLTEDQLKKDLDSHYEALQNKVEKKIGKIIEVMALGGLDYRFKGENGECSVEVILAGGYNIQKLHTRWIIKK